MKKHSAKSRNRKIRQKNQPPRSAASDTYTNPPAFLGAASNLISSGTWIRSGLTSNTDLLTTLYRESWLAKHIIDMPAEDMTRAWYSLTSSERRDFVKRERIHAPTKWIIYFAADVIRGGSPGGKKGWFYENEKHQILQNIPINGSYAHPPFCPAVLELGRVCC